MRTPIQHTPTARGREVRDKVCQTTRELLCTLWLDELNLNDLARRTGYVRASLLYQYPGGLAEILVATAERELLALAGAMREAGAAVPLTARLGVIIGVLLQRARAGGKLYLNLRAIITLRGETLEQGIEAVLETFGAVLGGWLQEGVDAGLVRPDLDQGFFCRMAMAQALQLAEAHYYGRRIASPDSAEKLAELLRRGIHA